MKKFRFAAVILVMAMMLGALTSCGIVKIIPKGTEADYTGVVEFDASAEAAGDWAQVVAEVTENAVPLAEAAEGLSSSDAKAVTFTATLTAYSEKANGQKCSFTASVDGVSDEVTIQAGSVYTGTAVRDCQSLKSFGSFTNQNEWSEYAKTLNAEVQSNVIEPLGDLSALEGKTVEIVGCVALGTTGGLNVVPVSVTVQ